MDSVALWLAAHQPPDALDPAVVHGDFKLDNVLLDPLEPARLVAVFDWEMAALGDPLIRSSASCSPALDIDGRSR